MPGGIFDYNIEINKHAFQHAVTYVNEHILQDEGIELKTIIREVAYGNEFRVSALMCELFEVNNKTHLLLECTKQKK